MATILMVMVYIWYIYRGRREGIIVYIYIHVFGLSMFETPVFGLLMFGNTCAWFVNVWKHLCLVCYAMIGGMHMRWS